MARGNLGQDAALDDFVGDFASGPLRDGAASVFGCFAGESNDLTALLSLNLDWASGARHVAEALIEREVGERNGGEGEPAGAPAADGIDVKVEGAGDVGVVVSVSGGKNDAGAQGKLLGERAATEEGFKVVVQLRRKLDDRRFWTSHGVNSQF